MTLTPEQKETYNEFRRARRAVWQQEIDKRKMGLGCQWPDCKNIIDIPAQLEFAHFSQEEKDFDISTFLHRSPYIPANRELLEAEIEKCRVLCLLHHRLETIQGSHMSWRRGTKPHSTALHEYNSIPGPQRDRTGTTALRSRDLIAVQRYR